MVKISGRFFRLFITYCIVAVCWGILVPLLSYRIFRLVFSGLISSFLSFKIFNLFSPENLIWDIGKGSGIVLIFLGTFISVVWLREQIMIGGPPNFMNLIPPHQNEAEPQAAEQENNTAELNNSPLEEDLQEENLEEVGEFQRKNSS